MQHVNPFYTTNNIPSRYFCDRAQETETLVRSVTNGNNMVLMSPRRMGKTGLINHVFADKRIGKEYNCCFIDIYDTSSLQEFTFRLGQEVFRRQSAGGIRKGARFLEVLKSIRGEFSYDPATLGPKFALSLGQIQQPLRTLEEILQFMESSSKPWLVAIDEFQQIGKYDEKNMEALLRTRFQRLANVTFIYSGSERHLLGQMFSSAARPFYMSTGTLELKPIDRDKYVEFARRQFRNAGKSITKNAVEGLYDLMEGYTFFMQKTLNEVFASTEKGGNAGQIEVLAAMEYLLDTADTTYRNILAGLSKGQRTVLSTIAVDGHAENVLSQSYISISFFDMIKMSMDTGEFTVGELIGIVLIVTTILGIILSLKDKKLGAILHLIATVAVFVFMVSKSEDISVFGIGAWACPILALLAVVCICLPTKE